MKKNNNKKRTLILLGSFLLFGLLFLISPVQAAGEWWAENVIGGIIRVLISVIGIVMVLVIKALVWVAQYNSFIASPPVEYSWTIVRDIANMFFVVVLLIISFATILNQEKYSYKSWLPKVILMAVLINFSKTICGILIDVAQVFMMTFVNAFKSMAAGNLISNLGIVDVVTMANNRADIGFWEIVGAYFLGLIYMIVALVVIVTMVAMLVMRMVMIWIYVALSPMAYLFSAFPGGQKYSSMWWSEFSKNLIVGPVLAFFIWLSFVSMAAFTPGSYQSIESTSVQGMAGEALITGGGTAAENTDVTKAGTLDVFIKFIISIGMLVGGLKIASEIGGAAGKIAGSGMAKLQSGAAWAGKVGTGAALLPWKGAKLAASYGVDKLHQKTGVDLNVKRVWKGIQEKRQERQAERYGEGQQAARQAMEEGGRMHGILAMTGNPGDAYEQLTTWKGIGKRIKGGRLMAKKREEAREQQSSDAQELDEFKYRNDFINGNATKRSEMITKSSDKLKAANDSIIDEKKKQADIDAEIATEEAKGIYKDDNKIESLKNDKVESEKRLADSEEEQKKWSHRDSYVKAFEHKVFSDKDVFDSRERVKSYQAKVEALQQKINRNIPEYNFEARAAEQSTVSKKMSKVKDIDDSDELLRILQDAISSKDKALIKAITLKMSKDGNDNEFLKTLAGNSGRKGLQDLMRQFSTKGSKNYAGFNEQEAFGLGSQIAEINKGTNHWGATAAYVMDNGKFRETTDQEHHLIRNTEVSKQQLQAQIRNNNRLAYGYHDENNDFHIDAGGVLLLKGMNNEYGFKNMETINENAAKYLYDALKKDENAELLAEFSQNIGGKGSLMDQLEKRLGDIAKRADFESGYNEVKKYG